jgi:hypothetical protein
MAAVMEAVMEAVMARLSMQSAVCIVCSISMQSGGCMIDRRLGLARLGFVWLVWE